LAQTKSRARIFFILVTLLVEEDGKIKGGTRQAGWKEGPGKKRNYQCSSNEEK